ncbi:peptidase T [Pirellula staleyi DSM 6068]|uniref:Peptidase T n=1 Tax=Pirellula staleyi (strain ATCC 27377 / DSM 6068 / ICPB 4128) TaxID=530564 RepID=D2QWV9_PIRSD|nr:peptidase T [Pirellula staleyi]ADB16063.1 peptidase T [Pirellula staleyi DSM 6068]
MTINSQRLLERFLRYVKIDTTADDSSTTFPSSPGQAVLSKLLAEELRQMGLTDVLVDEFEIVYATVPSNVKHQSPVLALNAHVDTSPETTGKNVNPQVIHHYTGVDLPLPANPEKVLRVSDNPELTALVGKTIITTDGTTLLGSDDKSGVAVIMELANYLVEHPEVPHGDIRLLFTCDEEIGQGVKHVNLERLAADVCYTLDGSGSGEIDVETFSADLATITVKGINIHPSIGKGRMVNAVRGAARFVELMPSDKLAPEVTEGRDGFMHPYTIEGGVAEVKIKVLLRDFDARQLADQAAMLQSIAKQVEKEIPRLAVDVHVRKQYRNLAEGLAQEPRAVKLAEEAFRRLGRPFKQTIIRGGTDGSQLTERGLPTPNLSTGEHNPHSPLEWTCLEEMVAACEVLVELSQLWGKETKN